MNRSVWCLIPLMMSFSAYASGSRPALDPIEAAIFNNDVGTVEQLLNSGDDPNLSSRGASLLAEITTRIPKFYDDTPRTSFNSVIQALIDHHANVNLVLTNKDSEHPGETILEFAVRNDALEMVRLLINAGADVNAYYCEQAYKYEFWGKEIRGYTAIDVNRNQDRPAELDDAFGGAPEVKPGAQPFKLDIFSLLKDSSAQKWSKNNMPCDATHTAQIK